jgi:hypothetical protein
VVAPVSVVDIAVNPNNQSQRYILFGNGRIDAQGGAVPITGQATFFYTYEQPVVVAIWITNWATGAGYMLDVFGAFQPLNGAPVITTASGTTWVNSNGLPYVQVRRYVAWSWDPAGTGQGYAVDYYGELFEFGGAPDPARLGPRWSTPSCKGLQMQWSPTKKGYLLDLYGGVAPEWGAATPSPAAPYYAPNDVARDIEITDWTAGAGYTLTGDGAIHAFGGASSSLYGGPYAPGADVARSFKVLSATNPTKFWQVWSGGQSFDYYASDPPAVVAGAGTNEVQKVTITGSPTGGSFTLTFSGQTTSAIAYNATAATVQTALQALSSIGSGNATVTGGPGPGTAWTVTFVGALAQTDVAQMTATSSLTGGTSPTVTVTTLTSGINATPASTTTTTTTPTLAWSYSDPQNDSQAAWELYVFTQTFASANDMTDPSVWASSAVCFASGINPTTRGITCPVDLANGSYRFYVHAKDTSGQWSPWSNRGWTQSIATPTAPTGLTATADNANYRVNLSATTGGTAALVKFEFSDDSGVTWAPVRGAGALTRVATTTAIDYDAPLGVARQYRATAYSTSPRVASVPSSTASATITATGYVLTAVSDPTLGGVVTVRGPVDWTRPSGAGVFQGIGTIYPTVVSDGPPKSRRTTLALMCETKADWLRVEALVKANSTLVLRDPFGEVGYYRLVGDWLRQPIVAAPQHFHSTDLPLVEVAAPVTAS